MVVPSLSRLAEDAADQRFAHLHSFTLTDVHGQIIQSILV